MDQSLQLHCFQLASHTSSGSPRSPSYHSRGSHPRVGRPTRGLICSPVHAPARMHGCIPSLVLLALVSPHPRVWFDFRPTSGRSCLGPVFSWGSQLLISGGPSTLFSTARTPPQRGEVLAALGSRPLGSESWPGSLRPRASTSVWAGMLTLQTHR